MDSRDSVRLLAVLAALASPPLGAAEHLVHQKGLTFAIDELTVQVGDAVTFTNSDEGFHNVFSISRAKSFDLGMFANGHTKSVTFERPGDVEVECSIHPFMKMTLHVVE